MSHTQQTKVFLTILGVLMLALTYAAAVALLLFPSPVVRVGGGLFFAFKAVEVLSTVLALLRRPRLGWQLFLARFAFDTPPDDSPSLQQAGWGRRRRFLHGLSQAELRFWWEAPQMWLGYVVSQWRVFIGQIDRVETLGGVTFVIDYNRHDGTTMGMSLGCWVNIWLSEGVVDDFEYHVRHHSGQLFMHEFGHTIDSLRWGWLYLLVVGIPSYLSQMLELATHGNRHQHRHLYAERWANTHAQHYFGLPIRDLL